MSTPPVTSFVLFWNFLGGPEIRFEDKKTQQHAGKPCEMTSLASALTLSDFDGLRFTMRAADFLHQRFKITWLSWSRRFDWADGYHLQICVILFLWPKCALGTTTNTHAPKLPQIRRISLDPEPIVSLGPISKKRFLQPFKPKHMLMRPHSGQLFDSLQGSRLIYLAGW